MKGEEWLRVKPISDREYHQAISDDEYKSVKHRVKKKDRTRELKRLGVLFCVPAERLCDKVIKL
ncbi:unnamed protein product [Brassica rapa subsp. trilocularis]